ncbi:unnamed protein product [Effrenium voratum]|nr:unnamed protein product [Effrenium voratum]
MVPGAMGRPDAAVVPPWAAEAAGQRLTPRSGRKMVASVGPSHTSSLRLDDSSGNGWLWSPRTGDAKLQRASAEGFQRSSKSWDIFSGRRDGPQEFLTPRALRKANLARSPALKPMLRLAPGDGWVP